MKLRLSLILLVLAIAANAQDVVQSVNFSYLNEKVSITYNFNVSEKGESFFVWVEAKTAKEKPLEMKTLSGNIGEVTAEGSKQIVWDVKSDGVVLSENVYFTVKAVKLPKTKLGKALLINTIFPGAGMKYAGASRNALLIGALGYGAVGAAVAFNLMAADNFVKYKIEEDPNMADKYYTNTNKFLTYSLAGVGTAAGIWAATYATSISKNKKAKNIKPDELKNDPRTTVYSAKSDSKMLNTRGLPPNLFAELKFADANGNGILEAGETGELTVKISNQGKGDALNLEVVLKDSISDKNLSVSENQKINRIKPNESLTSKFTLTSTKDLQTGKHKFEILVKEAYGFDMDPAYLRLPTYAFQAPQFSVSGYEIVDYGEGTGAITEDGQLQLGEDASLS